MLEPFGHMVSPPPLQDDCELPKAVVVCSTDEVYIGVIRNGESCRRDRTIGRVSKCSLDGNRSVVSSDGSCCSSLEMSTVLVTIHDDRLC